MRLVTYIYTYSSKYLIIYNKNDMHFKTVLYFSLSEINIHSEINKLFIQSYKIWLHNNLYSELWSIWPFEKML